MKVLVTGAKGFIGRNLVTTLMQNKSLEIIEIDIHNTIEELKEATLASDFIFHLAGINRPKDEREFFEGNTGLTETIIEVLTTNKKQTPILITSSIQADLDNAYGQSKKAAEEALKKYAENTEANIYIYRLPNVFGKWCRPNYNSAVATFCHKIARDEEIWVNDRSISLNLVYIDDVVRCFIETMQNQPQTCDYLEVTPVHPTTLGEIVDLLQFFKESRETRQVPRLDSPLEKKLYSTYLSYLPEDQFSYPLHMNVDQRGSFTEFIKTPDRGQVSVNVSKPGITKGNHWHHTKNEKFLVVSGTGVIRFRKVETEEVLEYFVSGEKLEVVDIPVGYTHNIENLGTTDMVTIMWCNECFDPQNPDTIFLEV
ncbi:NAD-dependent epimerase/dehydratase family protein [Turicibacter sanguinis]|uniref:polysaccharide biosynthesis C-terminal domain-containing protein n=1 Tax=Turicibacter sanguinis TaxID=154288 RepID=UPI0012BD48F6|nr:NAD-dependent epimerase/dehydratase family protein [Turicibacter sanguinis]MDB8545643.1 NAD-dependent epimerase/dehydratase family protein [Turicibacter sanguinis]MTO10815.1 NAD-dependent epimerase/dehydratase family protein [Turicibacter sanguinis]MTP48350.1 NAD-dependent epimerase/dehydratase family protein [Turicibacter sanguinis]MTP51069.1 NAD-dependent epimerase/dehydratase family protein [Turicibacter sanguinis]MTQ08351.1 NAD-dependent epimerase/dehydratase family protein [Turicibacte